MDISKFKNKNSRWIGKLLKIQGKVTFDWNVTLYITKRNYSLINLVISTVDILKNYHDFFQCAARRIWGCKENEQHRVVFRDQCENKYFVFIFVF